MVEEKHSGAMYRVSLPVKVFVTMESIGLMMLQLENTEPVGGNHRDTDCVSTKQ